MDLQALFPDHSVCLFSDRPEEKVWRIHNISAQALNYLRIWLDNNIISVAINWLQVQANTSTFYDEYIAHRIGLIPINADPLRMEDFNEENPNLCSENTCIMFELNINNPGPAVKNVLSQDLRWIPLGNQAEAWRDRPPRPIHDVVIAKLLPGQEINLKAYAVRGTGEQHAKWSATLTHFRLVPTRRPIIQGQTISIASPTPIISILSPETSSSSSSSSSLPCLPCEQIVHVRYQPGFNCYYFTVELVGGLSFDDINRQLQTRFSWEGGPSFEEARYIF